MHLLIAIFILLLSPIYGSVALANSANAENLSSPKPHPKICVVLSGGGARGFAHIGVLKYLEQLRIPIDCIAATSMGAVVGGLYASGMSASEIEKKMEALHLGDVALDKVDRRMITQTLREDDSNYPIAATFGLSESGLSLPLGAVQANQFLEILQNWTSHLPPNIDFDKLPVQFRTVATDLETGEMVVFNHGQIAMAIRSSMAAPGVFAPIEIDGRLLVDGGPVRNFPVDLAREMGADIIIGINTGTPLLPRDELTNFVDITQQMLNILVNQNVRTQQKLLTPKDILIEANLGTITFLDFNRFKEAVDIGYQTAQSSHDKLAVLSLNEDQYQARLQERPNPQLPAIRIAFIDVRSNGSIPAAEIRRQLNIHVGSVYDAADINKRITPLINSREYDGIVHELVQRDGEYGVEISASARHGPNFMRLGLELTSGFDGTSGFEFQVGHRLPAITESGLEWRNDIQFGTTNGIRSELRQPLQAREGMYIAPFVSAQLKNLALYFDNQAVSEYAVRSYQLGVDVGVPLGEYGYLGEVKSGLFATHTSLDPKLGGILTRLPDGVTEFTPLASEKLEEIGFHSRFVIDQLDAPYFPSDGYRIGGEIIAGINRNRSDTVTVETHRDYRDFQQITFDAAVAQSMGNNSLNLSMQLGARQQSGPAIPGIGLSLGGFQRLSAYQPDQFFGRYLAYGNATYLFRALNFELAGQAVFVGTSLEIGNAGDTRADFKLANLKKSLSVFVGAKTFMGPFHVGVAAAPGGTFNVFLQLGRQ